MLDEIAVISLEALEKSPESNIRFGLGIRGARLSQSGL